MLLSIGKTLFVAAFTCTTSKLMFKENRHYPFMQAPTNDGDTYQKPNGTCQWDGEYVTECECANVLAYYVDPHDDTLLGVVCSEYCTEGSCPPPKEKAKCENYGRQLCMLTCSSDDDCVEGAHCQSFGEGYDTVCMFKP